MTKNKMETTQDKDLIYFTRLNWIIFFWPLVLLCIAIILYFNVPIVQEPSMVLAAAFLIWVGITWINYQFSSITIKTKRVILRTGLLVRQTVDIPLNKIETIDIRQSIFGGLFRYGTLIITGTGGTRHLINYLDKPLTCRRYIEQLMNDTHP